MMLPGHGVFEPAWNRPPRVSAMPMALACLAQSANNILHVTVFLSSIGCSNEITPKEAQGKQALCGRHCIPNVHEPQSCEESDALSRGPFRALCKINDYKSAKWSWIRTNMRRLRQPQTSPKSQTRENPTKTEPTPPAWQLHIRLPEDAFGILARRAFALSRFLCGFKWNPKELSPLGSHVTLGDQDLAGLLSNMREEF